MAKLKGIYRFKDVLSLPSGKIQQNINFSVTTTPQRAGVECLMTGSAIAFSNNSVDYNITGSTPGDWISGIGAFPAEFNVYFGGWETAILGEGIKTVTIPYEQEVSAEFYETFTANTEYIGEVETNDVTIFYNGQVYTTLNGGEYVTLHTKGKTMEDDLRVEVARASGGDSHKPPEIATEAEMTALLDTAETGAVFKYTGATTDKYENGTHYIIEE